MKRSGRILSLIILLIWNNVFQAQWLFAASFLPSAGICTLSIDRVLVSDCDYGMRTGFRSKVIVAVFLSWQQAIPATSIEVRLNGQTKLHDPFMKGCPDFVQFVLDADGGSYQVEAEFVGGACTALPVIVNLPAACDPPVCSGSSAIGGKLYSDFNNNGVQDNSETGLTDVEIRLFDDAKQLRATTRTGTNGLWAVDNLPPGLKLRVEYQIPSGLFDSNPGAESKTRTQRATVGDCRVDLGIFQLKELIDLNPWIVTTCFAKGDARNPSSPAFGEPTLVANLYNTANGGPRVGPNGNFYLASAGETGSIWGLAYQKESRQLFSGAFLKRNASLGPDGLGAIYTTDLNGFLPNPPFVPGYRYYNRTRLLINLDSFGIATGDESLLVRNLPLDPRDASHDSVTFDKIGKWGLGDLDLNEAEDTLYVVNMHNRSLVVIDLGSPLREPITADRVREIPIPDPSCSVSSDWRPWGLKYKDGTLYVGGVCSAESSGNPDDLRAVVYAFKNGIFTTVLSFELNYKKGFLEGNFCATFRPWNSDFYYYHVGSDVVCGPVPVLSDIEFDSEGNMIVSLGDRYGYQTGGRDYGTNTRDGLRYICFSGGDNLKFFRIRQEYLMEQNGTSGYYTTPGANNGQGVCGGEFYFEDGFFSHQESVLGALAVHPSYNTIVATLMDPANIWSNGWSQIDNSVGRKVVNYNIFTGEYGTFGKSAGLGDIELLISSSRPKGLGVSLGNFIWHDRDRDGVQDPGEPPLSGVPVLLFDANDSLIRTTISDTTGLYYFRDLDPRSEYFLQLGADSNYLNGKVLINNSNYEPTRLRTRMNNGNSENDSDANTDPALPAIFSNRIAFQYKTGQDGENNFSLDFGLYACELNGMDTIQPVLCAGDSVLVGSVWFSEINPFGLVNFPSPSGLGCDSLLWVQTDIRHPSTFLLDTATCAGAELVLHGETFNESRPSGTIFFSGANYQGCDSVLMVRLSFHPNSIFSLDTSICPGESLTIHKEIFDSNRTSGQIHLMGANQFGCDSVLMVNVMLKQASSSFLDSAICSSESLVLHGEIFDAQRPSGLITLKGANQSGCDSLINVQLKILSESESRLDYSICPGEFLLLHGQRFDSVNPNGRILLPGSNQFGCDSAVVVNVKFLPVSTSRLDTSVCPGGSVWVHSVKFDAVHQAGDVVLQNANQHGCDSLIQVDLKILPSYDLKDTLESCGEYTWPVNGLTYKNSGYYRMDGLSEKGCDSIHQLFLTILPEYSFSDTICALDKFQWHANGIQYKESGMYSFNHFTKKGCDSIQILHLIVVHGGEVYLPNVFTPNGDQVNDRLTVYSNEDVHLIDLFAVYDRWGELVFQQKNFLPNDPSIGWDGNFRDTPARPAVYAYLVLWRDKLGNVHKAYGDVTLIR